MKWDRDMRTEFNSAISRGIIRGVIAAMEEVLYRETGRISPGAEEMLRKEIYLDPSTFIDKGLREALVKLGFLKKRWFKYKLTEKGRRYLEGG